MAADDRGLAAERTALARQRTALALAAVAALVAALGSVLYPLLLAVAAAGHPAPRRLAWLTVAIAALAVFVSVTA